MDKHLRKLYWTLIPKYVWKETSQQLLLKYQTFAMCSKIWSVNCTFHYARSQLYQSLTSRWNIFIKIQQAHFKISKLRCQLWKDSRSRRLPPLFKTHAPSLRESFTHSEISRAEVQMLLSSRRHSLRVPRKWNLQSIKNPLLSACHADQPHFNNPVTHEESCTTCQAVAVGLCWPIPCIPMSVCQSTKHQASCLPRFMAVIEIQFTDCQGSHRSASLHRCFLSFFAPRTRFSDTTTASSSNSYFRFLF